MASYKVPQDVEAEDKLIGPFSFRQFIYLIIAVLGIALAWGLSRLFIGLFIIPLPIVLFFGVMALPLRKDQPMETYMTAVVRFWLKPRTRLWNPEGIIDNVEITAPKVEERSLTKDYSGSEAQQRLSYLAKVVDTGGWATRGAVSSTSSVSDIITAESNSIEDVFDSHAGIAQNFDALITKNDAAQKQAVLDHFQNSLHAPVAAPPVTPTIIPSPAAPIAMSAPQDTTTAPTVQPVYNPYPTMKQRVISPTDSASTPVVAAPEIQPQASSQPAPSPDIMRLANNNDLSISTLAREAQRLKEASDDTEVVINLR